MPVQIQTDPQKSMNVRLSMLKTIILLCLLGIVGINGDPTGTCPSTNGADEHFLTDDSDCSKFYKCDWGTPVLQSCKDGLHFNPILNVCDWPGSGECDASPTTITPSSSSRPPAVCVGVSCPAQNGKFPVFHPHPNDCGRYCVCDWGVPIDMPCPEGLHFNPVLNVCDWPESACCCKPGEPGCPPVTTTPPGGSSSSQRPPDTCPGVSCPAENGEFPIFHPHPDDCGRYCVCDWGVAIDMPCPPGLHFNPTLNVCDWPGSAGCCDDGDSDCPVITDPTVPDGSSSSPQPPPTCPGVSCPAENGEFPVFHPHPDDCGRYCVCDWGVAIDMACPPGLHFNCELNVCDWPESAGCCEPGEPGCPVVTTPAGTTSSPGGSSSSQRPPPTCPGVSCPAENGEFPVFRPHPDDCGRYCVCDWGVPIDMPCPPGLHFNPVLNVCDWPASAGCCDADDAECPVVTTPPVTATSPPGGSSSSQRPPPTCPGVSCPAENGEFPVFHPHPDDCGRYCVCDWGVAIDMACPPGLHFNCELNVCDWPESAGCCEPGEPGCPVVTTPAGTTSSPGGSSSSQRPPPTCPGVSCPAENGEFPVFRPHPDDCGRYCVCDWGVPIDMPCPPGLHFNPILNVCDWPASAGCCDADDAECPVVTTPAGTTSSPGGSSSSQRPPPTCPGVSCPAENGEFPVFRPHPDDCGRYCVCDWGVPIDMPCPPGLHFNCDLNVCDWPESAGCCEPGEPGCPVVTTPAVTTSSPGGSSSSQRPPPTCPGVSCPAENGEFPVFRPHPDDCGRYCVCDWGVPIDMPCPPGLHFNCDLNVCDWPESAGCCEPGEPGCPVVTTPAGTTSSPGGSSSSQRPPATCPGVSCPAENGEFPVFHRHPDECGRYCKCDWGVAYDMPCPSGLHFNRHLNVCDWPQAAGCCDAAEPDCL